MVRKLIWVFGFLSIAIGTYAQPLSGNKYIPGDYSSLAQAVDSLNLHGVGPGGVIFNIATGYVETEVYIKITATGTFSNPIVFQKSGAGSNPKFISRLTTPPSTTNDYIIKIEGGDFITFDGIDLEQNPLSAIIDYARKGFSLESATPTDGAQFNTIKNCTIKFLPVQTIVNTPVISGIHSSVSVFASSIAGTNSYNKFYGNTIIEANQGMSFGSGQIHNVYNEIGVDGANHILGFYNRGIQLIGEDYIKIANNLLVGSDYVNFNGSNGLRSILIISPLLTNAEIFNNTISLTWQFTPSAFISGIEIININSISHASEINIYGNIIKDYNINAFTTQAWLPNSAINVNTSLSQLKIYGNAIKDLNTNLIQGEVVGIMLQCNGTGTTVDVYNNEIKNIYNGHGPSSSAKVIGIYNNGSAITKIYDNQINNISFNHNNGLVAGYYSSTPQAENKIYNNVIKNIRSLSTSINNTSANGIAINDQSSLQTDIFQNIIDSVESAFNTARGIYVETGAGVKIRRNKITNIKAAGTSGFAYGIQVDAGNCIASNNLIGEINHTGNGNNAISGIHINGGQNIFLHYNSICLGSGPTTGNFGSSGIYIGSGSPVVELKNNLVVNKSTPSGTGITAAIRNSSPGLTVFAITSNNNLFYAGTPSPNKVIYYDGTSSFHNMVSYKNHVFPRDSNAVTEDVIFISTNPVSPDFLRPDPAIPSYVESMAQNIAGLTDDFFSANIRTGYALAGQLNGGGFAPDIGAIEGDYTPYLDVGAIDFASPKLDSCYTNGADVILVIKNHSIFPLDLSKQNVIINAYAIDPNNVVTNFAPVTLSSGMFQAGTTMAISMGSNYNMSAPGLYQFIGWTYHPYDSETGNDTIPFIYIYENLPGTAFTADTLICPLNDVELVLTGTLLPSQWQSSTDGGLNWSNIPSGTVNPFIANPATGVLIRADVCGNYTNVLTINLDTSLIATMQTIASPCSDWASGSAEIFASGGNGNFQYSWAHNPALTSASINNLLPGIYFATITDDRGCFIEIKDTVKSPPPLELLIDILNPVKCNGDNNGEIDLIPAGGMAPYIISSNTGSVTPPISGLGEGSYVFYVLDGNGCVASSDSLFLAGNPPPQVNIAGNQLFCLGDSIFIDVGAGFSSYIWNTGENTPGIFVHSAGQFFVKVKDQNGCENADTVQTATHNPPVVSILGDSLFCPGDSVFIDAGPGFQSYSWSTGSKDPGIHVNAGGFYYVVVTDQNNCSNSDSIVVSEAPFPKIISGGKFCANQGQTILLANVSGGSWEGNGIINNIQGIFDPSIPGPGNWQIIFKTITGCKSSDSLTLQIFPVPELQVNNDTSILKGKTVHLFGSGQGNFNWFPSRELSCSSCSNPIASPMETTIYYVELEDGNGCLALDSVTVKVETPLVKVFVPNTFSPNGDGYNDQLLVFGDIESMQFLVFNRWGQKIFESKSQSIGWDGTFNGEPQRPGVFVYIVDITHKDGRKEQLQGNVTLVR